jgi:hypothetical protein
MSDSINIGSVQGGIVHVNSKGGNYQRQSGTLNIHADPEGAARQLRDMLDDLIRIISENPVLPTVREDAEEARKEAMEPQPETGRLRALMNAVISGAGKVTAVTQAALNIISFISTIENVIR